MEKRAWWKESVIYQIYPRSFMDSNGDGIGDINGITSKLDYLKELGIDIVWLSPVYSSPNNDMGYDISDYQNIMTEFGTLSDWEIMLSEMHKRGIKLVMDLVVNHTSNQHPWFIESSSSKDNDKRDYYIWRDGKDNKAPNNWQAFFTEPAWTYDEKSEQYYLHLFTPEQPDLNWSNKEVRDNIYNMMKWWLDKGVDGFRMDVINLIGKKNGLPDGERILDSGMSFDIDLYANQPSTHDYLHEMNREVLSKYDIMTVGETPGVSTEQAVDYVAPEREELSMLFQFEHLDSYKDEQSWEIFDFDFKGFKNVFAKWQYALEGKGWNSSYLGNHDQPRQVSVYGNDKEYREVSAKMLATMIHTLKGTPYIYQGDELGMTNIVLDDISESMDVRSINFFEYAKHLGITEDEAMRRINQIGRDNSRTPMQWNSTDNAGFTSGKPWMKINDNYISINAQEQINNPDSVFSYYKKLIALRHSNDTLVYGAFKHTFENHERVFAYTRTLENNELLVLINFFGTAVNLDINGLENKNILISNYEDKCISEKAITLRPFESVVFEYSI